jgi:tryptophan synthase beta chain
MNLIEQEYSTQRWIDIPEGILELLTRWRPAPLHRAYDLEEALKTPARIYYKNESLSPGGSHKPNTAVAQAWYNKPNHRDWRGTMGKCTCICLRPDWVRM